MVFSSNTCLIEFKTDKTTDTWVELIQTTAVGTTHDVNVEEWDSFNNVFTNRLATGGKKVDLSFEMKLDPENAGHTAIREIVYSDDITLHNGRQIRITEFAKSTGLAKDRQTVFTGVIKPTADGAQASTDVAVLNFDFMSSGKATITEATPAVSTARK